MSKKRSKIESEKVLSENSFKASKNEKGGNNGGVIIGILVLIIGVLYTYQNKKNPIANNHIVNDLNFTKYPVPLQLHHIQNKECENITNWISSDPIAPNIDSSNFWGAYRPGLYFGMRTKSFPSFLSSGIMWTTHFSSNKKNDYRHSARQDEIEKFEWLRNDGKTFGIESIIDNKYNIEFNASYEIFDKTKHNSLQWTQNYLIKHKKNNINNMVTSFMLYHGIECDISTGHSSSNVDQCFVLGRDIANMRITKVNSTFLYVKAYSELLHSYYIMTINIALQPLSNGESSMVDQDNILTYWGTSGNNIDANSHIDSTKASSGISTSLQSLLKYDEVHKSIRGSSNQKQGNKKGTYHKDAYAHEFLTIYNNSSNIYEGFSNKVEDNSIGFFIQMLLLTNIEMTLVTTNYYNNKLWTSDNEVETFITDLLSVQLTVDNNIASSAKSIFDNYYNNINKQFMKFNSKFEDTFHLSAVGTADKDVEAARRAISGVMGGVGYFSGKATLGNSIEYINNKVQKYGSDSTYDDKKSYSYFALFSATPSRTSFPRGFLWDEGFHQILLHKWDIDMSMDMINHWLSCRMHSYSARTANNIEGSKACHCGGGWIPRELILGEEAYRVVPDEFITQRVDIANPPSMMIVIEHLLSHLDRIDETTEESRERRNKLSNFLSDSFYPLFDWLSWYAMSQQSIHKDKFEGFRWHGRHVQRDKLFPNTLASGLDDYPRSILVSDNELHVDLHSWLLYSFQILNKVHKRISPRFTDTNKDIKEVNNFRNIGENINNITTFLKTKLFETYWSTDLNVFADKGYHVKSGKREGFIDVVTLRCSQASDRQSVVDVKVDISKFRTRHPNNGDCPSSHPQYLFPMGDGNGNILIQKQYDYTVDDLVLSHIPRIGYVTIFPLLLKLIDCKEHSSQLTHILDIVQSPDHLWSPYGLRSISKSDLFYQVENAPGDSPYWRGPIWLNINYLALSALRHYSQIDTCQEKDRANLMYHQLRDNIINNVVGEYHRTGYYWEHYNDQTGRGMRGHPFAGWTSIIVNIMAELY